MQSKAPCQAAGWYLSSFRMDATGGAGPAARLLCRRLTKALAMRGGADTATVSESLGTQISLALAKGRGEMFCAATPLLPSQVSFKGTPGRLSGTQTPKTSTSRTMAHQVRDDPPVHRKKTGDRQDHREDQLNPVQPSPHHLAPIH